MAKKTGDDPDQIDPSHELPAAPMSAVVEDKILDFAEDIGRLVGTAKAKASGWLSQREAIVKNLVEYRDMINGLLSDLGHQAQAALPAAVTGARRGRPAGSAKRSPGRPAKQVSSSKTSGKQGRPTGYKMSEETRRKMQEAAKKRWADKKGQS